MQQLALGFIVGLALLILPAAGAVSPRTPTDDDVCPVCGMHVAPHTEWLAQVVFSDGSAVFFDGSRDLFRYLEDRERYAPDVRLAAVDGIFVTSYYDLEPIAAEEAFFVVGSDVLGPMGAELVPHGTQDAADDFIADHDGRIVRMGDVTPELLESLMASRGRR